VLNVLFYTIAKGEHKQFDLSRDNLVDLDLEIVEVGRNSATIRAKSAGAQAVVEAPPLPLFNFTPSIEPEVIPPVEQPPVVAEPEPETKEETVPVTAEVKENMLSKLAQKVKDLFTIKLSPGSTAVKAGIVLAVVIIGLAAYAIFVRWESF
jgi:hypothetical protein